MPSNTVNGSFMSLIKPLIDNETTEKNMNESPDILNPECYYNMLVYMIITIDMLLTRSNVGLTSKDNMIIRRRTHKSINSSREEEKIDNNVGYLLKDMKS